MTLIYRGTSYTLPTIQAIQGAMLGNMLAKRYDPTLRKVTVPGAHKLGLAYTFAPHVQLSTKDEHGITIQR